MQSRRDKIMRHEIIIGLVKIYATQILKAASPDAAFAEKVLRQANMGIYGSGTELPRAKSGLGSRTPELALPLTSLLAYRCSSRQENLSACHLACRLHGAGEGQREERARAIAVAQAAKCMLIPDTPVCSNCTDDDDDFDQQLKSTVAGSYGINKPHLRRIVHAK